MGKKGFLVSMRAARVTLAPTRTVRMASCRPVPPRPAAPPKTAPVDSPPAPQRNGKTPQEVNMVLDALRAVRVNQAATLAHVGHDIVSKGQFARIDDVNVPYRGQAAEAVKEVFLELGAEDRAAGRK